MLREHRRTWPTLALFFQNSCIAHVSVNWLSPVKVRQTFIGGSRKMIVYDDVEATDKIKVYDKGITVNGSAEAAYQLKIGYRAGDMWAPHLSAKEALQTEIEHFVDCVCTGACPISNGITGLQVVRILEAASRSIQAQGNPIRLGSEPHSFERTYKSLQARIGAGADSGMNAAELPARYNRGRGAIVGAFLYQESLEFVQGPNEVAPR